MGVTILALHAAAVGPEMWTDVREAAPQLSFAAPDLVELAERAGGRLDGLVSGLEELVPAGPVLLLGCSIGCQLSLELGPRLGDRLRGILLTSPGPPTFDEAFQDRVRSLRRIIEHGWDEAVGRSLLPLLVYPFGPRYAQISARVDRMFSRAAARSGPLLAVSPAFRQAAEVLPTLHAPIRVLIGGANSNPIIGTGLVEAWRDVLGADAVERVEDTSEFLPMEKPELVAAELQALLARRD